MPDVFDSPRVQELLQQAEDARVSLDPGPVLDEALDGLYRAVGRELHIWVRRERPDLLLSGEGPTPLELSDLPELADYTGEDDLTEIPEPGSLLGPREESAGPEIPQSSLASIQASMRALGGVGEHDLSELLALLRPPRDLIDPAVMPDEASKVQWASGELAGRLADTPEVLQVAVLGMLAARARNVAEHLDVDIGPRMAIDRLRRYRDQQDLPSVAGLLPNARPELATWAEDARAFWELLRLR